MISRRVWVNLGVFVALFAVLAAWAVGNVVKIDRIERPYTVLAEFETSPGLQPNVEVTYLGIPVGSIRSVRLDTDRVVVDLRIDRGVELPEGISATVRRKSAVGEPYVALDPPEVVDGVDIIEPSSRYRIPLEQTAVPLSYGQLFASIDELVSAVPPDDFATVVSELATALDGRGGSLRRILASADDVTGTLATRSEVFDELARDLTSLTATLSAGADGIGSSFDNLAALTETLASRRADVEQLLADAPAFGARVDELLQATYADLSCSFADIGAVFRALGTPQRIDDLVRVLRTSGAARDALNAALVEPGDGGADGPYLGGSFGLTFQDQAPAYPAPVTLPAAPALLPCAAAGASGSGGAADAGASGPGDGAGGPASGDLRVPARERSGDDGGPASSRAAAVADRFPLATLLAALAVALLVALLAALRPWRWLPPVGRAGSGDDD